MCRRPCADDATCRVVDLFDLVRVRRPHRHGDRLRGGRLSLALGMAELADLEFVQLTVTKLDLWTQEWRGVNAQVLAMIYIYVYI